MKIKNLKNNTRFFGFRGARPGFNLAAGETSREIPATVAFEAGFKIMLQRGEIGVTLTDNDKRLIGKETLEKLGLEKKKKVTPAIPAEVKEAEEPVVEAPEVIAGPCEAAPEEEPEVCDGLPVAPEEDLETPDPEADEKAEEPKGFSLPKPPSKMNKADWLAVGMMEEVGLKNAINPGMTKSKLQDTVMARLAELGLIE